MFLSQESYDAFIAESTIDSTSRRIVSLMQTGFDSVKRQMKSDTKRVDKLIDVAEDRVSII